ncbi:MULTISPECIES: serine hydrolase domain-containing protein [unclassified Streptomyces]|uniref:serine hydrolase domain-containing protein n=1 Tax=unclassified Streptomyces TaxID=2593676 RepID=UPI00332D6E98
MKVATCVLASEGIRSHTTPGHDPDVFAEMGSLTKVVTGTILTQLAKAGALNVHDPLSTWLPTAADTKITLDHLARHTSGLPRLPPDIRFRDPYRSFGDDTLQALLPNLDALVTRPPGEEEEYSNLGYAILGAALVAAADRSYEELVDEYVLAPLGMEASAMTPRPPEHRSVRRGLLRRPVKPWTLDGAILPAAGLWATPRTMAALLRLVTDRTLGDPAPTWRHSGPLTWHNGATRASSVFAGALPDGRWLLMHRLHGSPSKTDEAAIAWFKTEGHQEER